jgi:LysM repeat protein
MPSAISCINFANHFPPLTRAMKPQTLPVKRRPVKKGILHRLSAVTRNKKQRVAAAAPAPTAELEAEDGGSKISRALTIIFLIHIVAIALIFVHQRFLDGRPADPAENATTAAATAAAPRSVPAPRENLPRLSTGEKPYVVRVGDNYARIAAAEGVDENALRLINKHVDIGPGLILRIPPKRIVAEEPPEVAAIREQSTTATDPGLVEAVDVSNAPRAMLVRPNRSMPDQPAVAASGKTHVVQSGESIWRIANRFKVSQEALMRANGITDAKKMKVGMKLVIPQS